MLDLVTMGASLQVLILGPVGVTCDDRAVSLTPQLRRLLGLLVVADGASVSSDRIADELGDGQADGSLVRTAISRLRKVLGDRVETVGGGYRIRLSPDELDARRFTELCEHARASPPGERINSLRDALAMWRGAALADVADEDWARPAAVRLDDARAVATEDLAEALIDAGQPARAVEWLDVHVAEHPYRERPVGLLMRALAGSGRVADALRAFQRLRATLRDEIGIEPTSELRELELELLGGLDPPRAGAAASIAALPEGTVTFLFTDIEASTERWQTDEVAMSQALALHDEVIRSTVERFGGVVFKHTGDGVCAAFTSAPAAIGAAVDVQRTVALPVRIGLHTGEAELRGRDYFGPTLNRTARVMDAGHGGQILVSAATAALAGAGDFLDHGEHHLKGLPTPEHIYQVGRDQFPPLRVVQERKGNLPKELTSFIGREHDVAAVTDTLLDHRLVTLIGVGGTGKTRLAVETAQAMTPAFPDGCWFVELAVVAVAEAVPYAFAAGLGITLPPGADVVEVVVGHLRHKRALVVVDNCEHVLAAAGDLAERIAADCPAVAILSTSREPLMLNGEHLVPVASLTPADAERLFVERAHAENPNLSFDADQREAVGRICVRLDGLPLAVELAASRTRAFTPVELLSLLDERFQLLVGGRRSRMERHQTLRGTIDWSYDLCDPVERAVFDRLSVFPAAFDLNDARAIAHGDDVSELDIIDVVPRLVDRSLLNRATGTDGTTRYRLLETMRAYGREHLKQNNALDAAWQRHATYIASTVGRLSVSFLGPDEERLLDRMSEYRSDALVALDWLIDHREWNLAARLPGIGVSDERVGEEMSRRLNTALALSGDKPDVRDVIERSDMRDLLTVTEAEQSARGWRALRRRELVPTDWYARSAVIDVTPVTIGEAEELIAALDRYADAPAWTRFLAMYFALRNTLNGRVDVARVEGFARTFDELMSFTAAVQSPIAASLVCELRGVEARAAGRWQEAAIHFDSARPRRHPRRSEWLYLFTSWNAIVAHALSGRAVPSRQLVELWQLQDEAHLDYLSLRAAFATAHGLERLGERGLADRFMFWLHDVDPGDVLKMYDREFGPFAELDLDRPHDVETLDALLADLERFAISRHEP